MISSYQTYDQLPLTLSADDITRILGISRVGAYELLHRSDFPTLQLGKRLLVPKDAFLSWMDEHTKTKEVISID